MEAKHFTHNHNLVFHQLQQGSEIKCSGCQSQGSGNVYACWQCNYFLHEQCFRATRSLKTPSHPLHSLTLLPYPTHQSGSFYCDICKQIGSGLSYCCAECEFDLHVHCALSTTQPFHPSYANPVFNPQPDSFMPPPPNYPTHNNPDVHFTTPTIPSNNNQAVPPPQPPPFYPGQNNPATPPPSYPVQFQNNTNPNFPIITNQAPTPPAGFPIVNSQPGSSNQPLQNNTVPVFPATNVTLNIPLKTNTEPKINEIRHFSHPHALKQLEFTKQDGKKCFGCGFVIDGSGYRCVDLQCNFYLEKSCFEAPIEVKHKSHLDHSLKLLCKPPYPGGTFTCNACMKDGTDQFVYNCSTCSFDLHVDCVKWPEKVERDDHEHPLTLFFSSPIPPKTEGQPEITTICDVCQTAIHEMGWTYSCHECDFSTHLECVINQALSAQKSDEDLINEAALKLKVLQLLLSGRAEIIL